MMSDLRDARHGSMHDDDVESWMRTPSSMMSDPQDPIGDEVLNEEQFNIQDLKDQRQLLDMAGSPSRRLEVEFLNALFDHCSARVVRHGLVSKEVTKSTMLPCMQTAEVQRLIQEGVPSWSMI